MAMETGHFLGFFQQRAVALHPVDIPLGIGDKGKATAAEKAVGRRAKAQILGQIPITAVVPGTITLLGEIGDFILLKSRLLQPFHCVKIHIGLYILRREFRIFFIQRRTLFQLESVGRDMLRLQSDDLLH